MVISRQALLDALAPEWPEDLLPRIQAAVHATGTKLIVLDDDPTGTQTVHHVDVLTDWSVPLLIAALKDPDPVIYLSTNTRSVLLPQAEARNREIAQNLVAAHRATGRRFAIISRSDSTLRGHYPGETQALARTLNLAFDATLVVPFFEEGGRITINDIHYVTEGDILTPAAETEYARDPVFGYRSSDLRAWVSEKHNGAITAGEVVSITLDDIRTGGPTTVARKLTALCGGASDPGAQTDASGRTGQICVVNAASYRDLEVVVAGILEAEARGCRFLYRTAASLVRVRGGIVPRPLLERAEFATSHGTGGLIVVGSHVQKTTDQVRAALQRPEVTGIELCVSALLDEAQGTAAVTQAARAATAAIDRDNVALVFTSRDHLVQSPSYTSLQIGRLISQALVEIVRQVDRRPRWMIAKGGITSSDIATDALNVRRARVLGQAIAGIPVWYTGAESRWPGLVYVVFPGNVGDDQTLGRMIEILR